MRGTRQQWAGARWRVAMVAAAVVLSACSPEAVETAGSPLETAGAAPTGSTAPAGSAAPADGATVDPAGGTPSPPSTTGTAEPTPAPDPTAVQDTGSPEAQDGVADDVTPPDQLTEVADGDSGEAVALLQQRLTDRGFDAGPADGVAGRLTVAAIEAFQAHAGLPPTGVADAGTLAALDDEEHTVEVLSAGASGASVERLQSDLAEAPFDPGPADGVFGDMTVEAVYALQKLTGLAVDGDVDGVDRHLLDRLLDGEAEGRAAASTTHDRRWVDVDLSRQVMAVYEPGRPDVPILASHISSGNGERWCNESGVCGVAATPTGSFTITRRIAGWRESSLDIGALYNPLYFRGGIALHGARSVPLYPASHGCVRVPMHIAEYLPGLLPNGTPVDVHW